MKATRKKASKKEFILKKAAQMFREKGFAATSMRDLAETVGIEAASLYNHIRSKNEMLESICFEKFSGRSKRLPETKFPGLANLQWSATNRGCNIRSPSICIM